MKTHKFYINASQVISVVILSSLAGQCVAADYQFYSALKSQVEYVLPDKETSQVKEYIGLRDSYSRMGLNVEHKINEKTKLSFKLEVPVDSANREIQDPWNQETHKRILKLQLDSVAGSFWIGQDWMPYYNAVAAPVDRFSSYYSGFATYTVFRLDDTLAYVSPDLLGLKFMAAHSRENGSSGDDRTQFAVKAKIHDLTMIAGVDDLGGVSDSKILGIALQYKYNNMYLAAKMERFDSNVNSGYGADGDVAMNMFGSFEAGKNTWKIMLADVENYGEQIIHLGWDYQYRKQLKLFVEYYSEEETAAITDRYKGLDVFDASASGGTAVMTGFHYQFESQKEKLKL